MSLSLPNIVIPEENERCIRRLEHNALTRENALVQSGFNFAIRDRIKEQKKGEWREHRMAKLDADAERTWRWTEKLQGSPLDQDQWAIDQKIYANNRAKEASDKRAARLLAQRRHEAHNVVRKRACAEHNDLDDLREERRQHVVNEKLLKAMRDVEKSNGRVTKIFNQRKAAELEKQGNQLNRAMSGFI